MAQRNRNVVGVALTGMMRQFLYSFGRGGQAKRCRYEVGVVA